MRLESIPVYSEGSDECFLIRLDGEDIGNVESNVHVGDKLAWSFYSMKTEVIEGPFPSRRAAEKALAKHHDPNYGVVDADTLDDLQQETIRLLDASNARADAESPGQRNYRYGIITAYDALTRVLSDHPILLDADFHASEVRED